MSDQAILTLSGNEIRHVNGNHNNNEGPLCMIDTKQGKYYLCVGSNSKHLINVDLSVDKN